MDVKLELMDELGAATLGAWARAAAASSTSRASAKNRPLRPLRSMVKMRVSLSSACYIGDIGIGGFKGAAAVEVWACPSARRRNL